MVHVLFEIVSDQIYISKANVVRINVEQKRFKIMVAREFVHPLQLPGFNLASTDILDLDRDKKARIDKTSSMASLVKALFTQDAEHLATRACKLWNTLQSMGVFTQIASNIKRFACKFARKCASASCVNGA